MIDVEHGLFTDEEHTLAKDKLGDLIKSSSTSDEDLDALGQLYYDSIMNQRTQIAIVDNSNIRFDPTENAFYESTSQEASKFEVPKMYKLVRNISLAVSVYLALFLTGTPHYPETLCVSGILALGAGAAHLLGRLEVSSKRRLHDHELQGIGISPVVR